MKKKISKLVLKQRELTRRSKMRYLLWDSAQYGTYIKTKYGKLLNDITT